MVVRNAPDGWYLVRQADHARLAAELAGAWEFHRLPGERDAQFLAGVRDHDAGWESWDDAPRFHPSGEPVNFFELPVPEFLGLWRNSITISAAWGPVAGYIVSRHFHRLAKFALERPQTPPATAALEEFLACQDSAQSGWISASNLSPQRLEQLTDLLQVCDLLSLLVITAGRLASPFSMDALERLGIRCAFSGNTTQLNPSPLAQPIRTSVESRFVARPGASEPLTRLVLHFLVY